MTPRPPEDPRASPEPIHRPRRQPRRQRREDRVTEHLPTAAPGAAEDRVTRTRVAEQRELGVRHRQSRRPEPMVLPHWRQLATFAAPNFVAAASIAMAMLVAAVLGEYSSLFVVPLVVPSVVLGAMDRSRVAQGWRAAAGVNLATLLVLFPFLVIRQSAVHVPYLTGEHGTMFAAIASTLGVLGVMVAIALFAAWASRQDPESSSMLFLPAAMLVPLLTSASEFASLDAALAAAGMIFALSAMLTLVSSLMPPIYTVFVGPIAVAMEVLFMSLIRQDQIFPVGVAAVGMALFALVIFAAIALMVLLPGVSTWMQRVENLRARRLEAR